MGDVFSKSKTCEFVHVSGPYTSLGAAKAFGEGTGGTFFYAEDLKRDASKWMRDYPALQAEAKRRGAKKRKDRWIGIAFGMKQCTPQERRDIQDYFRTMSPCKIVLIEEDVARVPSTIDMIKSPEYRKRVLD